MAPNKPKAQRPVKRRKFNYTVFSYIFIAMGLVVIFMMSDVVFSERNNLTLLKGAISSEFDDRGIYENVGRYGFMMSKDETAFLSYMDLLGYEYLGEIEDTDHIYFFADRQGNDQTVYRSSFMGRYIMWDFPRALND